MLYKLFSTKVDQHYLQLVHWYKRRHTSYPSCFFLIFFFYGWQVYALRMWNNQSFGASIAGDKSQDLQANGDGGDWGEQWQDGLKKVDECWWKNNGWMNATLIMLYRLVQFNSFKNPKENVFFPFLFFQTEHLNILGSKPLICCEGRNTMGFQDAQFSRKAIT